MSKNLTRLRSFMSDESYAKVVSYLPQEFDIDQFTLSFIHCFPDEGMKNLLQKGVEGMIRIRSGLMNTIGLKI